MAFAFVSLPKPVEAPVEHRNRAPLVWQDTASPPDTWLVELRTVSMSGFTVLQSSAYVAPYNSNTGRATIDMDKFVEGYVFDQNNVYGAYSVAAATYVAPPSLEELAPCFNVYGFQFDIYPVTGGTVGSLGGSYKYIPIFFAKQQKWNWNNFDFTQFYPDSNTKKGFLTDRPLNASNQIEYHFALEDEAVVNALQLENYNYVYDGVNNTNGCSWDRISYTVYEGGSVENILVLNLSAAPTGFEQCNQFIPIGPANIKDNPNWASLTYDLNVEPWDYYLAILSDSGTGKARTIKVIRDCRPIKHNPAQLWWINEKGGSETLRFDGRVKETYDLGGREAYKVNDSTNDSILYAPNNFPDYNSLPGTGKKGFILSEDFFTDIEREIYKTALTSEIMMVRYDGTWYPCELKTTNYVHEQASSRLAPITVEVTVKQDLKC